MYYINVRSKIMGTITRALANNITTGGVVSSSGISNTSVSAVTSLPSGVDVGDLVLISEQTAYSDASISFTSGIDSTYDVYCFKFYNIHGSNDTDSFQFNGSTDGGSTYSITKTTTVFQSEHREDDSGTGLAYQTGHDQHDETTTYQRLGQNTGNQNDENLCGELWIYEPSSTTYVKHFMARTIHNSDHDRAREWFVAGMFRTTSAIDAIQFKMENGNVDDGT